MTQDEQKAEKLYLADADGKPLIPFSKQDKSVRDYYLKCVQDEQSPMYLDKKGQWQVRDEQGIRADLIRTMVIGYGFIYGHKHVKKQVDKVAGQILSQTVSRGGGKCPECDGEGETSWGELNTIGSDCEDCNSTGSLPVEEKSIKDILLEGGWR